MEDINVPNVTETEDRTPRINLFHLAVDAIQVIVLATALFFGINAVSARVRVDGSSMEPTLHNGQLVIVNRISYRFGSPQKGDIIVFHYPRDPIQEYVKRVIGLPGDTVEVRSGQVYVNNQALYEPYIAAPTNYGPDTWIVPPGALFVLGDNRNNSHDSHKWGTLPFEYIVGKAVLVYWPPKEWGIIQHVTYAAP